MVMERVFVRHEHYAAIILDRKLGCPELIVSEKGGMNIEEVDPKYIFKFPLDPIHGMTPEIASEAASKLRLPKALVPLCEEAF